MMAAIYGVTLLGKLGRRKMLLGGLAALSWPMSCSRRSLQSRPRNKFVLWSYCFPSWLFADANQDRLRMHSSTNTLPSGVPGKGQASERLLAYVPLPEHGPFRQHPQHLSQHSKNRLKLHLVYII
jgi:hypothetical protein